MTFKQQLLNKIEVDNQAPQLSQHMDRIKELIEVNYYNREFTLYLGFNSKRPFVYGNQFGSPKYYWYWCDHISPKIVAGAFYGEFIKLGFKPEDLENFNLKDEIVEGKFYDEHILRIKW